MESVLDTLVELQDRNRFPTDKNSVHSYLPIYDRLFAPFRARPVALLEIGVGIQAGSLRLWQRAFPAGSVIHGLDVESVPPIPGIHVFHEDVRCFVPKRRYDIVIDDGSHSVDDQIIAFERIRESVHQGGLFVIEDILVLSEFIPAFRGAFPNVPFVVHDNRHVKGCNEDVLVVVRM